MKTLGQLIRLSHHKLLERQKTIARLEAQIAEIKLKADQLDAEALIEEARAEETQFGIMAFAPYFARVKTRRAELFEARKALDQRMVAARALLKKAFDEMKRIETLRDQKLAEAKEAERKADQAALDEVALQQHRRAGG
jgi:flagellar export protein FliJ